jgi:hypothetical protein
MPWVRLDDRFPSHRKVRLLSDAAFRLYVSAVCWSAESLTDGVIKTAELRLVADVRAARKRAEELVNCGLWEEVSGVGWRIHDYHEYNPTAEQVRADRKAKSARQQRWREKKNSQRSQPDGDDVDASTDTPHDASRDGAGDTAPRARIPDPTRPSSGTEREESDGSGGRGPGLSLIPETWQPNSDTIQAAQAARTAAGRPVLTGAQLAEVTRKFIRRMIADRWQTTPAAAASRWIEWAERERPTDTQQPPLLLGLPGGQPGPAWPHEQPQQRAERTDATPMPPSFRERMAALDAEIAADHARNTG